MLYKPRTCITNPERKITKPAFGCPEISNRFSFTKDKSYETAQTVPAIIKGR